MGFLTVVIMLIISVKWLSLWKTGLHGWRTWRACSTFEVILAQFYPLMTTCTRSVPSHGVSQVKLWGSTAELQVWECCFIHVPLSAQIHKVSVLLALPKRKKLYLPATYIRFTIFRSEIWGYVYNVTQVNTALNLFSFLLLDIVWLQERMQPFKSMTGNQRHYTDVGDCKLDPEMACKTSNYPVQGTQLQILK